MFSGDSINIEGDFFYIDFVVFTAHFTDSTES